MAKTLSLFLNNCNQKKKREKPTLSEFQMGRIDDKEDSIEPLQPLQEDLNEPGLVEMMPVNGKSFVQVEAKNHELTFLTNQQMASAEHPTFQFEFF